MIYKTTIKFAGLCLLTLLPASMQGEEVFEKFTVKGVSGSGNSLQAKGKTDWAPAKEGDQYVSGATGQTKGGSFKVEFDAKNSFRILPGTTVVVSPKAEGTSAKFQRIASVTKGEIEVEIDQGKDKKFKLEVQTPTAVCGAVGTKFKVKVADEETFDCKKLDDGQPHAISVKSLRAEDGAFEAASIKEGQSLNAQVKPGKENSYVKLDPSSDVAVTLRSGGKDHNFNGKEVVLAQEKRAGTREAGIRVGSESYIVAEDGSLAPEPKEKKGVVSDYIDATSKEGDLKKRLDQAPADEKAELQKKLDQAADEATEKRKALMQARQIIRDTIRNNMNNFRTPTQVPRSPR